MAYGLPASLSCTQQKAVPFRCSLPQPSSGPFKFLQLAQLEDGAACLPLYKTGISLLESHLSHLISSASKGRGKKKKKSKAQNGIEGELVDTPGIKETRSRLASAYCAVAELYMTDLCDEEDAETNLEKAIERALELQPDSTEALLCDSQLKKIRGSSSCCCCYNRYICCFHSCKAAVCLLLR